jgi:L-fuculose-phosphate aldolase
MGESMGVAKRAIVGICQRLYDRGYVVATSGNVSVREDESILITPTATRKDSVSAKAIIDCGLDGTPRETGKKPSSEIEMHCAVYNIRSDVGAAIHAHPPFCVACSILGFSLVEPILPELSVYTGPAPTVPFATPGTPAQAKAVTPYLSEHNAMLLERHGVLVLGRDLEEAFSRLEQLEYAAHIIYLVKTSCGR